MNIIGMKARKELKRISRMSGYSYNFLKEIYVDSVKDDGKFDDKDWFYFEGISMERDW